MDAQVLSINLYTHLTSLNNRLCSLGHVNIIQTFFLGGKRVQRYVPHIFLLTYGLLFNDFIATEYVAMNGKVISEK
jgi:hypothetical protein